SGCGIVPSWIDRSDRHTPLAASCTCTSCGPSARNVRSVTSNRSPGARSTAALTCSRRHGEDQREVLRLADTGREVDLAAFGDVVHGDALVDLLERDLELEAREVRPEAAVRTAAECEVAVRGAVELHLGRVLELGAVAVGRTDHQRRAVARGHLHAGELVVLG